jgi:hypothetical protein
MGTIKLSIGQLNITGYLLVNVREVNSPNVVVASLVVPPPVPTTQNIVFNNMNDVVHYIDFRESPDGVSLGLLLSTFVYDVATGTAMAERRFYTAGGVGTYDPAPVATTITDPYLTGKIVYGVFKEGFRYLIPGVEYSQAGDTITLLSSFNTPAPELNDGEIISVEINFTVSSGTSTANTGSFPKGIIQINASLTLGPTHINSFMEAQGPPGILTVTFPDFATIPDNSKFAFSTDGGDQTHLALVMPAGRYVQIFKRNRGTVWLARGEQITLIKKDNYLRVISLSGDFIRVGERVSYDGARPLNGLEETGGWYLKSDFPRLWEYINELPPADVVASADDSILTTSRTKWNAGATKFWMPDRRGYFDRISNGTRRSGDVEAGQVGQFDLTLTKANGFTGAPGAGDVNKFAYGSAVPVNRPITVNAGAETRPLNTATIIYRIF